MSYGCNVFKQLFLYSATEKQPADFDKVAL